MKRLNNYQFMFNSTWLDITTKHMGPAALRQKTRWLVVPDNDCHYAPTTVGTVEAMLNYIETYGEVGQCTPMPSGQILVKATMPNLYWEAWHQNQLEVHT